MLTLEWRPYAQPYKNTATAIKLNNFICPVDITPKYTQETFTCTMNKKTQSNVTPPLNSFTEYRLTRYLNQTAVNEMTENLEKIRHLGPK